MSDIRDTKEAQSNLLLAMDYLSLWDWYLIRPIYYIEKVK